MDNEDREYNIKENSIRVEKQYYIDLKGRIHKYKGDLSEDIISIHLLIADNLFPDVIDPDDYIMDLGWILIGSSVYNSPIIHKKPTQKQIDTLFDLGLLKRLCIKDGNYYKPLTPTNK